MRELAFQVVEQHALSRNKYKIGGRAIMDISIGDELLFPADNPLHKARIFRILYYNHEMKFINAGVSGYLFIETDGPIPTGDFELFRISLRHIQRG